MELIISNKLKEGRLMKMRRLKSLVLGVMVLVVCVGNVLLVSCAGNMGRVNELIEQLKAEDGGFEKKLLLHLAK
jgi:hypothetical protein